MTVQIELGKTYVTQSGINVTIIHKTIGGFYLGQKPEELACLYYREDGTPYIKESAKKEDMLVREFIPQPIRLEVDKWYRTAKGNFVSIVSISEKMSLRGKDLYRSVGGDGSVDYWPSDGKSSSGDLVEEIGEPPLRKFRVKYTLAFTVTARASGLASSIAMDTMSAALSEEIREDLEDITYEECIVEEEKE